MEENKDLNINESIGAGENTEKFDIIGTDEVYKSHNYKKKKRGIAGFFQKIGGSISGWWRPMKKWKKVLISVATSFVALLLALVITVLVIFDYNYKEITTNPEDLGFEGVIDENVINIALFGIDTRSTKSFSGNSDSIMVLSINTQTDKIKIVSIMRDSLVKIERDDRTTYNKINSAYAFGGPELAIKTINQNFGLDISEYATVNFYGMAEIIDAVGGIDIELTEQEVYTDSNDGFNGLVRRHCKKVGVDPSSYYIRTPGKHHVNGIQAVAYSRIRKFINVWGTNNDFGRTDRQRYVMEQLFNKAITLKKTQYISLVRALIPYTETSLSYGEIMDLAGNVLLESPTFEQSRMPKDEYLMDAPRIPSVGSTVYYDLEFAKELMHAFFYDDITPEEYVEKNGVQKNDWYSQISGTPSGNSGTNRRPDNSSTTSSKSDKNKDTSSKDTSSEQSKLQTSEPTESVSSTTSTDSSAVVSSSSIETPSSSIPAESSSSDSSVNSSSEATPPVSSSEPTPSTPTPPASPEDGNSSENTTTQ